jgi:transposase
MKDIKTVKKVVGIDVSKDNLVVCFGTSTGFNQNIGKPFTFKNNSNGFKKLLSWTKKAAYSTENDDYIHFVMEATGVYYENLAYFLEDNQQFVAVLLPTQAKYFFKTLKSKSKTDPIDAAGLTQLGLEKSLEKWNLPNPFLKDIKDLTRERQASKDMIIMIKSRLHAKNHSYKPQKDTLARLNKQLALYNKQVKEIEKTIKELVEKDENLTRQVKNIQKVEGLGFITVITIIAETSGFVLIENKKQITSYAGLDVVHNQSGNSQRKTRISKRGNKYIRAALYMPAVSASRCNPALKKKYLDLIMRKNNKMIAITAISRKLLELIYTLWKKNEAYIPQYQNC